MRPYAPGLRPQASSLNHSTQSRSSYVASRMQCTDPFPPSREPRACMGWMWFLRLVGGSLVQKGKLQNAPPGPPEAPKPWYVKMVEIVSWSSSSESRAFGGWGGGQEGLFDLSWISTKINASVKNPFESPGKPFGKRLGITFLNQ